MKHIFHYFESINYYLRTFGLPGLTRAIEAKVRRSPVLFKVERDDIRFPFYLRMSTSDIPTYGQVFLDQEYNLNGEEHPSIIIDAGAHIGLATIYFANKYPNTKIISIEPEHDNFELLKINVAPYNNIIAIQAALWDHNGEINLIDPGMGSWGFMTEENIISDNLPVNLCHKVKAITVDNIIEEYQLDKIDIFKIDIEGAEKEVFNDASSWIEKVDTLIIELHDRIKTGCSRNFYNYSNGFNKKWRQGENIYLSRNHS